ncbi:MAG: VOC family protein, partial [Actinomycetota bacterium]|nr:VOC family protein [Actinomycetota bacterium]
MEAGEVELTALEQATDILFDRTYRGEPAAFTIKVCFADVGALAVEIMQPLSGPSIFAEHLARHGEGIHHVAFDIERRPWKERLAAFAERGFDVAQSGRFNYRNAFAFVDTENATGTTFEPTTSRPATSGRSRRRGFPGL